MDSKICWIIFVMHCSFLTDVATDHVYVSQTSESQDTLGCGNFTLPCLSITYAVQQSSTAGDDTILLDAYYEFQQRGPLCIVTNLTITSYNTTKMKRRATILFAPLSLQTDGLNVSSPKLTITGINMEMTDALYLVTIHAKELMNYIELRNCNVTLTHDAKQSHRHTDFYFYNMAAKSGNKSSCSVMNLTDTNFNFYVANDNPLIKSGNTQSMKVKTSHSQDILSVTFNRCRFIGQLYSWKLEFKHLNNLIFRGCFISHIRIRTLFTNHVLFEGCNFKNSNFLYPDIIKDDLLRNSTICFNQTKFVGVPSRILPPYGAQIDIHHQGTLKLDSCIFEEAKGGSVYVRKSTDIVVDNTNFLNNYLQSTDFGDFSAAGLTIYAEASVKIRNSTFINNTASLRTFSDMYVMSFGDKRIKTELRSIKVLPSQSLDEGDKIKAIWVAAFPHGSAKISNIQFFCPLNYIINATKVFKGPNLARMIACLKCSSISYNARIRAHIKIKRNKVKISQSKCYHCPYEATCVNGIRSKGNYWGYTNETGAVVFKPCPPKFCCVSPTDCSSYNTCGEGRRGRLCGDCIDGYSLSILGGYQKCVKTKECTSNTVFWVWYAVLVIVLCLFLLYNREGILFVMSSLTNLPQRSPPAIQNEESDSSQFPLIAYSDSNKLPSSNPSKGKAELAGIIKITFLFYQVASITRINASAKTNYTIPNIVEFFSSFFNIRIELQSSGNINMCPLSTNRLIVIEAIKVSSSFVSVCFLAFMYIMYVVRLRYKKLTSKDNAHFVEIKEENRAIDGTPLPESRTSFPTRIKGAYAQLLILGYSSIANFLLHSVNCVDIDGELYLYLQAESVECYQHWQFVVFGCIAVWLIPFPIAVYVGCRLLQSHSIGSNDFIIIITFPPAMLFYACKHCRNQDKSLMLLNDGDENSDEEEYILSILNAPFRRHGENNEFRYIWEPVFLGRRLILLGLCTFILSPMEKLYPVGGLLLLFLMHDIVVQPFMTERLNYIQYVSTMLLILLTMINFFWAFSNDIDISESETYSRMGHVFLLLETVILLSPIIYLLVKLSGRIGKFVYKKVSGKSD